MEGRHGMPCRGVRARLMRTPLIPGLRRNSAYPSRSHLFRCRLPKWLFCSRSTPSDV
jgi:hypothetical protein